MLEERSWLYSPEQERDNPAAQLHKFSLFGLRHPYDFALKKNQTLQLILEASSEKLFRISVCEIGIHFWALLTSMHSVIQSANLTKFHDRKWATRAIMDLATLERGWLGLMTGPSDFVQCRSWPAPDFWRFLLHSHFLQSDLKTQLHFRRFPGMIVGRNWYLHSQRWQGYHVNWRLEDRDSGKRGVRNQNGEAKRLQHLSPLSIPTWATSLCNKWFSTGSGCQ